MLGGPVSTGEEVEGGRREGEGRRPELAVLLGDADSVKGSGSAPLVDELRGEVGVAYHQEGVVEGDNTCSLAGEVLL